MQWVYGERWNNLLEEPIEPFGESEARRRHEAGNLYTAIREGLDKNKILVEVRLERAYVGVRFLDELARDETVFSFRKIEGRLFLREVISYEYGDSKKRGGHAEPVVIESFTFTPDGKMRREIDDSRQAQINATDYNSVDVSDHWEPIPSFGEYDSIIRRDRD